MALKKDSSGTTRLKSLCGGVGEEPAEKKKNLLYVLLKVPSNAFCRFLI
jgi:hypothetical protein